MKAAQLVFRTAQVTFGTAHVVFQSLADATMNAEAAVINKTGYWEKDEEGVVHQYKLSDYQLGQYKVQRKMSTRITQKHAIEKISNARALFNKNKATLETVK